MAALIYYLVFCQALGAFSGAIMAVWGERAYVRAMRDGQLDQAERTHLRHIAGGLRFGMFLLLLSSFGLVVVMYYLQTSLQPALTPSYWMLIILSFVIIGFSWALSRKRISFTLGSAVIFTGWWFLVLLTFGELPALSFSAAAALYVVLVAVMYGLLSYGRLLLASK